ncbi:hypothetical protein SJI00_03100 [Pseudomonas sp. RP23018S]|uniref:hypothetical protein n=1 Tax=Pseudomonas sp. RP23018S TaxID=3096037 RepID=UPI002ACAAE8A|nr:hypothetical protein [Pseudomonas sp. RP23018S]MDZ5601765.1 hypothetical protein [Pseudomonas sp. RP23018S]
MNKRLSHLLNHTWRASPEAAQPTAQQMRQLLGVLLLVPGALLVLSGAFATDVSQLAIGVLVGIAGGRLLRRSRPLQP